MRTQLLCLESSLGDGSLARRGHAAWSALSRATHYHAYELAPTREELLALCEDVEAVIIRAAPRSFSGPLAARTRVQRPAVT